jgi:hypothetical protein
MPGADGASGACGLALAWVCGGVVAVAAGAGAAAAGAEAGAAAAGAAGFASAVATLVAAAAAAGVGAGGGAVVAAVAGEGAAGAAASAAAKAASIGSGPGAAPGASLSAELAGKVLILGSTFWISAPRCRRRSFRSRVVHDDLARRGQLLAGEDRLQDLALYRGFLTLDPNSDGAQLEHQVLV